MIEATFFGLLVVAGALLVWSDLRLGIIPNWLNIAIAAAGLARVALLESFTATIVAAGEGIAVGALVWLLRWLFFRLRKYQGLGLGDVKLLAASGIWIGIAGVPIQLLVASLSALTAAAILHLAGRGIGRKTSLPFGPFLVLGLLTTLWIDQSGGLQPLPWSMP